MKLRSSIATCLVILTTVILLMGSQSDKARSEMAEGKQAYKRADFSSAADHFKAAADMEDDWVAAKFALASAYTAQFVPDTPDQRYGEQAISVFLKILERDPKNVNALKDIALLYMYSRKLDPSAQYAKKAVAVSPDDPDLYYLLGVLDWAAAYKSISTG